MNTRPVSIAHLVMGIVFTGIAAIWLVGEVADVHTPGFRLWGPGLLVAAGVIGLVATVVNARRRDGVPLPPNGTTGTPGNRPGAGAGTSPNPDAEYDTHDHSDAGTDVVEQEESR